MRWDIGIVRDRLWTVEWAHPREWWTAPEQPRMRRAWMFLCHWPRYDDYWLRIFGLTLSGRRGLAEIYRRTA